MPKTKKKKEKDFQKVKLKVGRKIPKCLNETDTSFQTRKILMPSSRVMDDDPIHALLSSLADRKSLKMLKLGKANGFLNPKSDHGSQVKPELITVDVINAFCRHLMDEHHEVRKEALDGLNNCFDVLIKSRHQVVTSDHGNTFDKPSNGQLNSDHEKVGSNQDLSHNLDAVITVVITHLKCALTHLDSFIYKDSWKLLISLIEKLSHQLTNNSIDQLGYLMVSVFGSRTHPIEHYESLALVIEKMLPNKDKNQDNQKQPLLLTWSKDMYHIPIYNYYESQLSNQFCISFNQSELNESIKGSTIKTLKEILSNDFLQFKKILDSEKEIKLDRRMKAVSRIYNRINQ